MGTGTLAISAFNHMAVPVDMRRDLPPGELLPAHNLLGPGPQLHLYAPELLPQNRFCGLDFLEPIAFNYMRLAARNNEMQIKIIFNALRGRAGSRLMRCRSPVTSSYLGIRNRLRS
jgi:hypothetical protein